MQHADQREEPPRGIEVELDLAREAFLQELRALVMKRPPTHIESFDLLGRSLADGFVVAIADYEVVLDYTPKRRERQHHLAMRQIIGHANVEDETVLLDRQNQIVWAAAGTDR